jgi:hypothetical protein
MIFASMISRSIVRIFSVHPVDPLVGAGSDIVKPVECNAFIPARGGEPGYRSAAPRISWLSSSTRNVPNCVVSRCGTSTVTSTDFQELAFRQVQGRIDGGRNPQDVLGHDRYRYDKVGRRPSRPSLSRVKRAKL